MAGADGEEPPHGHSKAMKVPKSTSLGKMTTHSILPGYCCTGWIKEVSLLWGWRIFEFCGFWGRLCCLVGFTNTAATHPELPLSFTGIASGLDWVYFVPVCCSGMQLFHWAGPASCFPCKSHHIPESLQSNSSQGGSENIQIAALCFLTPNLLHKDTKSIREHTACLNIFVVIKYIKKCPKHAIIPCNALWPYYFVKPSTLPQVISALKIYFLNNISLESSICQQILTYSSPVEFTFYHHRHVVYKFSCHSSLQIISCTCG